LQQHLLEPLRLAPHHPLSIWLLLVAVEAARAVVVVAVIELIQVMQLQQAYRFQSL
jgi:hypothetical protein